MDVPIPKAVALGLIAGAIGGLFGIGGGVIVVPGLVLWLKFDQYKASGTSVATIVASAGAALLTFSTDGSVDWRAAAIIAIGAVAGAAIGARILHLIPAHLLRRVFSAVLVVVAARMVIG